MTAAMYEAEARWDNGCLIASSKNASIARHVYQRRHGVKLPTEVHVLHTCDRPDCILDAHHFLGSHADNMKDCAQKGRHTGQNLSPAARSNIAAANRKKKLSSEAKAKILEGIRRYWAAHKGESR